MNQYIYVRPRDDGQGWAVDVYDGRRAWTKTHLGERPLNKAEAHRVAHKLRDPKFYSARTKRAVNSGAREGMAEARVGMMPSSGIPLPYPPFDMSDGEAREAARVRAESFCACGRRLPECDGSRAGSRENRLRALGFEHPSDEQRCEHLAQLAAYEEVLATRREHERRADERLNDALSGEADAVRRAESAELGCEIAYRREPTQAEGDAHEYRHDQSMGASKCIRECHVPMGNHHGHRCPCGRWVWGGPTVCQRCVDAEAVKIALEWKAEADRLRLRADTDTKLAVEWEKLFNERNRLWREEADRVGAVKLLLEKNGCDCACDHDAESHDSDCDRCLACRISWAIEP